MYLLLTIKLWMGISLPHPYSLHCTLFMNKKIIIGCYSDSFDGKEIKDS